MLPPDTLDGKGFVKVSPLGLFVSSSHSNDSVFAVGDVASSAGGIKLASTAIRGGRGIAFNIASLILCRENGLSSEEASKTLMNIAMPNDALKLVIGGTAAAYTQGRSTWGVDVKQKVFGEDMALSHGLRALGVTS
ncbi:hypothetical protein H2198_003088 [Neophaeococcomyces mojaviensis]|uniref:Uncharacterized protein n=1 Tax=Neophaeococcomyces mojaviensis TaxID=3383035 RepID=A0ACC3ACL2_9EURO|nr:hypothetical protein H2198_003088 [Knufia sp. JES_112]